MTAMNSETAMRVNARLDPQAQEQIKYLIETTGQGVSLVVREAVAHYYMHVRERAQHKVPKRLLAMVGKGRSRDGRTDVASNYKKIIAESIAAKYGLPPKPKTARKP
jgi:predicted DNA-binding protein